jgi:hypothetical protein
VEVNLIQLQGAVVAVRHQKVEVEEGLHHWRLRREPLELLVAVGPIVGSIDNKQRSSDSLRKLHMGPDRYNIENTEQRNLQRWRLRGYSLKRWLDL